MTRKLKDKLRLTQDQFEDLWAAIHKTRSTSRTVTLDKQAVSYLLMDYSAMIDAVKEP